jgi:hypothetical protein
MDAHIDEEVQLIGSYGRQTMRTQKALHRVWEQTDLDTGLEASIESFASMWEDGGTEPKHYMGVWMARSRDKDWSKN